MPVIKVDAEVHRELRRRGVPNRVLRVLLGLETIGEGVSAMRGHEIPDWLPQREYREVIAHRVRKLPTRTFERRDLILDAIATLRGRFKAADTARLSSGEERCFKSADWAVTQLTLDGVIRRIGRGQFKAAQP